MTNWRKYNGALIPDQPPHIEITDSDSLINKKIGDNNVFFARWTTKFDRKEETDFWYIICDEKLTIEGYSKNTRSKIRRGLRKCEVKLVNKEEIKQFGFLSYSKAFQRYNADILSKNRKEFEDEIDNIDKDWHFWAIYNNDNLMIGYSQNKIAENYCDYSTIKFHPDYLKLYPSYALFFTMNQYYLNEKEYKYVNDGARSISHETNIQSFLIQKFRFRKAYCKLHIQYHPLINILIFILFPFRLLIIKSNNTLLHKIGVVLMQEELHKANKVE